MTDTSKHIRTVFYHSFKDHDIVLISVDINGLLEIENAFLELSQGLSCFDFSRLRLLDTKYHVDIKAFNDRNNIGIKQTEKGKFEWRITRESWNFVREKATALYRNGNDGHQYLESETNYTSSEINYFDKESLQVVLSFNEYSLSFWEEHFETCNG